MKAMALFIAITLTIVKIALKVSPMLIISDGVAQQYAFGTNVSDTSAGFYETNSPTSIHPNRRYALIFNKRQMNIRAKRMMWDSLKSGNTSISSSAKFTYIDGATGEQCVAKMDSLNKWISTNVTIPLSHISGTSSIASTSVTAGSNISVSGSAPNYTVAATNQTTGIISNITPTLTALTGMSVTISGESYSLTNTIPDKTVTVSAGNGVTITSSYPAFTVALPAITSNTVSHSLNSSFSLSATQGYDVSYSVYTQVTSALTGTNTADAFLERSIDNSTWVAIGQGGVMVTGVLSTSGGTQGLFGFVPAGYFLRIRTAAAGANSGSAIFTYKYGLETTR